MLCSFERRITKKTHPSYPLGGASNPLRSAPVLLLHALIHRSSWKVNSQKFSPAVLVFEDSLAAGHAPYFFGDAPVGPYLVENDVDPSPTDLLDVCSPYGRAQRHDPDARTRAPQLADELPPVPVWQRQIQDRHVQGPIEICPIERLPGLGQGAGLGDHLQLGIGTEQRG